MRSTQILFLTVTFIFLENAWAGRDLASMFGSHPAQKKCVLISSFPGTEENPGAGGGLATLTTDGTEENCLKKCDEFYQSRVEDYGSDVSGKCRIGGDKFIKTYGNGPYIIPHKEGGFISY